MTKIKVLGSPRWANEKHTAIIVRVLIEGHPGTHDFVAMPTDVEPHGRQIYSDIMNGQFGDIGAYVPPPPAPKMMPVHKP